MANHKKHPVFIRIVSNNQSVVCINPLQLSSFQITEKAKIKQKDGTIVEADTLRLFFPSGTGLSYTVGVDISPDEFLYVCNTLREFLYLNEYEFKARSAEMDAVKLAEWNALMAADSEEDKAMVETPKA